MIRCFWLFLALSACRSTAEVKGREVQTVHDGADDSAAGTVSPPREDTGGDPVGPIGVWSSCMGELALMDGAFTWEGMSGECSLSGSTQVEDDSLLMQVGDLSSCSHPPWWLEIFEAGPAEFAVSVSGGRLTLVPSQAVQTTRVAHFEENLQFDWWVLTSAEGDISHALICSVEGVFFGGYYEDPAETCEFLSCSGQILGITHSGTEEHWSTISGGDCPGSGIVTVETRSEGFLTGRYFASNCARIFQSTFTGAPR
jgi:hypothetical protein